MLTPKALAEVLNTADDAAEINEFNRTVLFVKDFLAAHPVHQAMALRKHYSAKQFSDFAEPGSKQKDRLDWRGVKVGNKVPIWDHYIRKDSITGDDIKGQWYKDFVDGLTIGTEINQVRDMLVKCSKPDDYDLKSLNTIVWLTTTELGQDGRYVQVKVDARTMNTKERDAAISKQAGYITTIARGYRKAAAILQHWERIENDPAFKDQIKIDWNWHDVQDKSKGLTNNNVPFMIKAINPVDGGELYRDPVSLERFLKLDPEGVVAAAEKENKKPTVRDLLDSKWSKPEDRTGAGQGVTSDGKRASAIKVQGDNSMKDVLSEMVPFFGNDGTVTAFKQYVYSMKAGEQDHVWHDLVELYHQLDKIVNDDMEGAHQRVVETVAAQAKAEKAAKAKLLADAEAAERAPSQNDKDAATKWREQERARQAEAERVLSNPAITMVDTPEPVAAKPATFGKTKTQTGGKTRAAR